MNDDANTDWEARGINERRLGLLILENKGGPELAAGATHLRNAAEAFEKADRDDRRAECLLQLGRLQRRRELDREAAEVLVQALRLYRSRHDDTGACDAAMAAADAWAAADDWREAERRSAEAVALAKEINDHLRIAEALRVRGRCCTGAGSLGEAVAALQESIRIFEQWRKRQDAAVARELLGCALLRADDRAAAHAEFEQAADTLTELARLHDCTALLSRWAEQEMEVGDPSTAAEVLARVVDIHRKAKHQRMLCDALRLRGRCLIDGKRVAEALPLLEEALELAEILADDAALARCCYVLGLARARSDDEAAAHELLDRGLALAEATDDLQTQERILATKTRLLRQRGDSEAATTSTAAWLATIQKLGDRKQEIKALGALTALHQEDGSLDEAEEHLRRLLVLCEGAQHERERIFAHRGLAALAIKRGEQAEALPHLDAAITHYRAGLADPTIPVERLVTLERLLFQRASCHVKLKDAPTALADLRACLDLLDKHLPGARRDPAHLATVLNGMASALRHMGQADEAKPYLRRAQEICEDQGTLRATGVVPTIDPQAMPGTPAQPPAAATDGADTSEASD